MKTLHCLAIAKIGRRTIAVVYSGLKGPTLLPPREKSWPNGELAPKAMDGPQAQAATKAKNGEAAS
jgi:hypothetical protein